MKGCGNHGCIIEEPKGMGTNSICKCKQPFEFQKGDQVIYMPFNDHHHMYVVQVNVRDAFFQDNDITVYGLSNQPDGNVTSVTTGRSIKESKHFQPMADME